MVGRGLGQRNWDKAWMEAGGDARTGGPWRVKDGTGHLVGRTDNIRVRRHWEMGCVGVWKEAEMRILPQVRGWGCGLLRKGVLLGPERCLRGEAVPLLPLHLPPTHSLPPGSHPTPCLQDEPPEDPAGAGGWWG